MSDKLIAPKLCAWCREAFTPKRPAQIYCPLPFPCRNRGQARGRQGQVPIEAVAARKAQHRQFVATQLREAFGDLSDRELALYDHVYRVGYNDGYSAAYTPLRKRA